MNKSFLRFSKILQVQGLGRSKDLRTPLCHINEFILSITPLHSLVLFIHIFTLSKHIAFYIILIKLNMLNPYHYSFCPDFLSHYLAGWNLSFSRSRTCEHSIPQVLKCVKLFYVYMCVLLFVYVLKLNNSLAGYKILGWFTFPSLEFLAHPVSFLPWFLWHAWKFWYQLNFLAVEIWDFFLYLENLTLLLGYIWGLMILGKFSQIHTEPV